MSISFKDPHMEPLELYHISLQNLLGTALCEYCCTHHPEPSTGMQHHQQGIAFVLGSRINRLCLSFTHIMWSHRRWTSLQWWSCDIFIFFSKLASSTKLDSTQQCGSRMRANFQHIDLDVNATIHECVKSVT
jgi:hypothetical protein